MLASAAGKAPLRKLLLYPVHWSLYPAPSPLEPAALHTGRRRLPFHTGEGCAFTAARRGKASTERRAPHSPLPPVQYGHPHVVAVRCGWQGVLGGRTGSEGDDAEREDDNAASGSERW